MSTIHYQRLLDDDFGAVEFEKIKSRKKDWRAEEAIEKTPLRQSEKNVDFRCVQCKAAVSADRADCGVNNRNHCPHCLWSRHVDLHKPGDRLAECRSRMQPIGLTMKQTLKKYGSQKQGELMLIHLCTACGKLSINRIAADDDPHKVFEIFEGSFAMETHLREKLIKAGIHLLNSGDTAAVYAQLFGWQGIVDGLAKPAQQKVRIKIDESTLMK